MYENVEHMVVAISSNAKSACIIRYVQQHFGMSPSVYRSDKG